MVSCHYVDMRLLELLGEEPPEELVLHVRSCSSCQQRRDEWARIWSLMDRWEETKPTDHVGASILSEIRNGLRNDEAKKRRRSWRTIAETLGPLVAATAIAFLGVALAVKKVGPTLEPLPPLALLTCGIVWVAVYNIIFFLSSAKLGGVYRVEGVKVSLFARHALAALGVWLLITGLSELTGMGKLATELFSPRVGVSWNFLVGAAYSFIPLAFVSLVIRGRNLTRASAHGVLLGVFFLFLLAPEIFLYCNSFSLGIAFTWTVGTIVGCVTGGPAGVWLGLKVAQRSAA